MHMCAQQRFWLASTFAASNQNRQWGRHYENTPIQIYWKFHLHKPENLQIKISDIFHISAQNIDCGYSLLSQSMFSSKNLKNNANLCNPRLLYITVGLRGSKLYRHVFVMLDSKGCKISSLRRFSLVRLFVVRTYQKVRFLTLRPIL